MRAHVAVVAAVAILACASAARAQEPLDPATIYAAVSRQAEAYRAEAGRRLAAESPDDAVDRLGDEAVADPSVAFDRWAVVALIECRRDLWFGQSAAAGACARAPSRDPIRDVAAVRVWMDEYVDPASGTLALTAGDGSTEEELTSTLDAYTSYLLGLPDTPTEERARELMLAQVALGRLGRQADVEPVAQRQRGINAALPALGAPGAFLMLPEGIGPWRVEWASPRSWAPFIAIGGPVRGEGDRVPPERSSVRDQG